MNRTPEGEDLLLPILAEIQRAPSDFPLSNEVPQGIPFLDVQVPNHRGRAFVYHFAAADLLESSQQIIRTKAKLVQLRKRKKRCRDS